MGFFLMFSKKVNPADVVICFVTNITLKMAEAWFICKKFK